MKKRLLKILSFYILLVLFSCANVSAPTGGPKDKTPPKILKQTPISGTTSFNETKMRIWFDEYVTVKELNTQFLSSPPLQKPPKFILKGKSVEFTISDTLKENTTYNLNFGNSIVDINESNPLHNFNIAFSTGKTIDSLQIKGQIVDAFNFNPVENVLILLYNTENYYDSIPYYELPDYIGRSNKNGSFNISYIKGGKYKLFALEDLNKNRIFDMPNERISFIDSVIEPVIIEKIILDTLNTDSVISKKQLRYYPDSLTLLLFEEENYKQYIADAKREKKDLFRIIMNDSLTQHTAFRGLNFSLDRCYTEFSAKRDSVTFYIKDTNTAKIDTLILEFKYQMLDTLNNLSNFTDTLKLIYKEKKVQRQRKKHQQKIEKKNLIDIKFNVKNSGRKDLNSPLSFELSYPIALVDKNKIKLEYKSDTSYKKINFDLIRDSVELRKYYIEFKLEENTDYKLFIDTNAFKNSFGLTNDTIIHYFISQEESYYGNINLKLENLNSTVIVQLIKELKDKEIIIREQSPNTIQEIDFRYIKAGDYKLKLIFDNNNNGKWDTGKYLKNIQPERIIYYKEPINIKSNWDIELIWNLDMKE